MDTRRMVLRSVFVDPDVDREVRAHAKRQGATASSTYRLFLNAGLAQFERGVELPPVSDAPTPVLRTVSLSHSADERLEALAILRRIEKADLSRRVTRLGMLTIQGMLGTADVSNVSRPVGQHTRHQGGSAWTPAA